MRNSCSEKSDFIADWKISVSSDAVKQIFSQRVNNLVFDCDSLCHMCKCN